MNEQETTDDIIAEMRRIRVREFQDYADRLDAAYRREKAAIEADALSVGGIVGATVERSSVAGNFAALRDAAKDVARQLRAWAAQIDPFSKDGSAPRRLRALAARLEGGAK